MAVKQTFRPVANFGHHALLHMLFSLERQAFYNFFFYFFLQKKKQRTNMISSDEDDESDDEEKAREEMQGFIAVSDYFKVSLLGVDSLWGDCTFISADWRS